MASTPSRSTQQFPPASTSSPAFPQHPHLHQRTLTSSSASSASFPANVSSPAAPAAALSLDALLAAHATAPDSKLAALDQAVNERNTLSSQNSQLWKLIEKQRTGYNQILKELERVRGERDGYKAKITALVGGSPDRRRKENGAVENLDSPRIPRTPATAVEDSHTPRAGRSHQQDIATFPSFQSNSTATPPRQKSSLAPLLVPPRAESLPMPASALGSATPDNAPFGAAGGKLAARNDATPSTATSSASHGSTHSSPPQHRSSPLASTPQTAIYSPQTAPPATTQIPIARREPQITTSPSTPVETPSPDTAQPTAGPSMLSTLTDARGQTLSRESRISLPDEARQYIANMGDTPVPSPMVDAFAPRVLPPAPSAASANGHEFLDLDDDEPEEEDDDDELPADDEDAGEDEDNDDEPEAPEPTTLPSTQPLFAPRRPPQAAASDFPLPPQPPSQAEAQAQAQAMANTQAQALAYQQAQDRAQANLVAQQQQQQRALAQQQQQQQQMQQAQMREQQMQQHFAPPEGSQAPLQPQRRPSQSQLPSAEVPLQPQRQPPPQQQQYPAEPPLQPVRMSPVANTVPASFRALPLISTDLPKTTVNVSHSFVRPNDRGKEVLSFVVFVDPGNNKEGWKVEKMYSDVLALDQRVRNSVGKGVGKKMVSLPEGKLWKDHAPAKVDQRKAILETYLQALVNLPVKNNDEVIAFFTSDIVREYKQPVMQAGHKEGYLTKRGKNFGGWKTRFFVLQGPVLEYYDCRGGAHLGSIAVTGAQIGRQQRSERPATDEEKEYRHAFLIVEAKKGPGGNHPRHVLCAESDADRDSWVEILVRYFSGIYSEEAVSYVQQGGSAYPNGSSSQARPSTDANSQYQRSASPARSIDYNSPIERPNGAGFNDSQTARRVMEQRPQPSSLPDSSPLATASAGFPPEGTYQRANSEQGYYPDMQQQPQNGTPLRRQHSPEQHRTREGTAKGFHPTLNTVVSSPITPGPPTSQQQPSAPPPDRSPSPEKPESKVKISGPMHGAPIPSGFKFGGKDAPPPDAASAAAASERREKAKSRSFWGFGRPGAGGSEKAHTPAVAFIPRAVFGVTLEESLDVAQIANLPAIVFRCIQYLEAKKADQEEGIYRLSGSSAVIKSLKDRFNMEGDIDLVGSDEYWDPHAIAGLLKSFLRELPASILTHNLHLRFLSVIDFVDPQERIRELSQLISALPIANYSLLRALTAHLILIVQNSTVNKMTMRNVGIVFSPTLGIPAGVFSLMLGEFNRVFNVDADGGEETGEEEDPDAGKEAGAAADPDLLGASDRSSDTHRRRNSRQYSSGAADQLLGLSGRSLTAADEGPSDDDSVQYESETTEDNVTAESSNSSPGPGSSVQHEHAQARMASPMAAEAAKPPPTKAASTATSKGLNVSVTQSSRGNRYSTMMGLPASPRPPQSPRPTIESAVAPPAGTLQAAVLGPVCFFLGVLFICFNIDHRVLWGDLTADTIEDGFQFYTTFFNAPPAIKALLHGMVGVVLLGLIAKLHVWDDSAMFFDGSCIGGKLRSRLKFVHDGDIWAGGVPNGGGASAADDCYPTGGGDAHGPNPGDANPVGGEHHHHGGWTRMGRNPAEKTDRDFVQAGQEYAKRADAREQAKVEAEGKKKGGETKKNQ
ncbi:hypothetical protein C8F04DRAFT_1190623 [Mycena alexandri]|uniref:RhoGAP-domain-containing protein n=1 Tax=Mycena alexandri TaxID=1745969 RepID=A0AAD6SFX6_9AGAR|nr:hypothetical protein C8F04DRAFT_1190623 [Mycena alexandri]